jgi:hypothetical protein
MLRGASPRDVFKALHLDAHYIDSVEKAYNPSEPRVPAGSGRTSGEWTDGEGAAGDGAASEGAATDSTANEGVPAETAKEETGGAGTSGSSLLSRMPAPPTKIPSPPATSFLGELTAAQVAELGAYALRVLRVATPAGAAAAVFGLLFIPSHNDLHVEGDVPDIPGLRYSWNRDETRLYLTYDKPGGGQLTFATYLDDEKFYDDSGQVIGRVIEGNRVVIDAVAVLPHLFKNNEPRMCPAYAPDVLGSDRGKSYDEDRARQYEDFVKRLINPPPVGPTPSGFVYYLPNPEEDDTPVSYDDCEQQTTALLFEIKGEQYTKFLNSSWAGPGVVAKMLRQSLRQVQASGGRPVIWIVAEEGAAILIRQLFDTARDGRQFITVVHVPWTERKHDK